MGAASGGTTMRRRAGRGVGAGVVVGESTCILCRRRGGGRGAEVDGAVKTGDELRFCCD